MKLLKLKPYTNSIRHRLKLQKNLLSKTNNIFKSFKQGFKRFSGHSSKNGRITVRHKSSGHKKKFSNIEFSNKPIISILINIMYDSFKKCFISLNFDLKRQKFFRLLSTYKVGPGSVQSCTNLKIDLKLGNRYILFNVPTGSILHSLGENKQSKFVKSAGTFFQILQKTNFFCKIKLPSGTIKTVSTMMYGTLGKLSNIQLNSVKLGKAGCNRWRGKRPSVRGIAMNPVDHPHGGRSNKGCHPMTPWGKPTRGKPSVKKKLKNL
jgi:large subunit ribosomal protein L2